LSSQVTELGKEKAVEHQGSIDKKSVAILPEPTAWPFVLAIGLTLLFASLVTNTIIGYLGGVLVIFAAVGWFRDVLPHEKHEVIPVVTQEIVFTTTRKQVTKFQLPAHETGGATAGHEQTPIQANAILSGLKGGIAGGIAMIFPALLYGQLRYHSIWYTVNLLGGAGVAALQNATPAQIAQFHWGGLLVASLIQAVTCILVGLLYGALLPILPRHPIILGGLVAPALWTGLLHSSLGLINPFLDARIDWWWFAASQVTFGLVAGYVVSRQGGLRELRSKPFAVRMGIEMPGLGHGGEKNVDDGDSK
jgi:hypothetical protein